MTDVSTEEAVDTLPNPVGRPATQPFGITAPPGSKLYHRLYSRAHKRQRLEQARAEGMAKARAKLTPTLDQHISLRELAKQQGWPVDRVSMNKLKRYLLARQKLCGVVILFQLGVSGPIAKTSWYFTTMGLLRRYASELFTDPKNDQIEVKEFLSELKATVSELRAEIKQLKRRIKLIESSKPERSAA